MDMSGTPKYFTGRLPSPNPIVLRIVALTLSLTLAKNIALFCLFTYSPEKVSNFAISSITICTLVAFPLENRNISSAKHKCERLIALHFGWKSKLGWRTAIERDLEKASIATRNRKWDKGSSCRTPLLPAKKPRKLTIYTNRELRRSDASLDTPQEERGSTHSS